MNGRIYLQKMSVPAKTEETEKIFREMLKGSEDAFGAFFCRIYPGLMRYALTLLPYPTDEAEDMVSEVFCTMWKNRKQLSIQGSVSSYLYVAVKHRIYDHIKKQKISFEDIDADNLGHPAPEYLEPDNLMIYKELDQRILYLIGKLPNRTRLVFLMNRDEGLTYSEIASVLDITVSSVKTHMYRALKFLNQSFYYSDKSLD
jgi:RNA polymerase sigma-70 factor (family 1)